MKTIDDSFIRPPLAAEALFQTPDAKITGNSRLREPQLEAHSAIRQYYERHASGHVILQIPVGCGKTGVMATVPFGVARGRVLVITPNTTIRRTVSESMDIAGPKCFWKRTGVLGDLARGPHLALLDGLNANVDDCVRSHFVVTNIQQLASSADRWLPNFAPDFFDMILVDEGHHNAAPSWLKVFDRFPNAKVISLTATPFRGDHRQLEGEIVYRYPFTRAMVKGYIKQIHSSNVAPDEISFTYRGEAHRHTLEEVLALREEQWFSKGVALSQECNAHIVDASISKLNALRSGSQVRHQVIAVACSVDHARQIRDLYVARGLAAREIHSDMDAEEQEDVLGLLDSGRLDCIVQVQMLGEGFDHPPLSVAAIFRPFRSLSPYIQFVGRVMRVVHEGQPGHRDNQAHIVSHVGLNNDEHWDDFRELDLADQEMFRDFLQGHAEEDEESGTEGGGAPRRFDVGMQVTNEILGQYLTSDFLNLDDDRVMDQLLASPLPGGLTLGEVGGFTRESLRARLKTLERPALTETPSEALLSPQRQRQYYRSRLKDRSNSAVARILRDLELAMPGREVSRCMRKVSGRSNQQAVTELLNCAINELCSVGSGKRAQLTLDQARTAYEALDKLADDLTAQIREVIKQ